MTALAGAPLPPKKGGWPSFFQKVLDTSARWRVLVSRRAGQRVDGLQRERNNNEGCAVELLK